MVLAPRVATLAAALALAAAAAAAPKYLGPATCSAAACHGAKQPTFTGRTNHTEFSIWTRRDKHAKAYLALGGEQARAIGEKMGVSPKSDRCLKCHSQLVPAEQRGEKFDLAAGNTCGNCHGPASGWIEGHAKARPEHKGWTHAQSVAAGMTETLDLYTRASMCVKCHLAIDHEMLEAGHPYLTFELDAFTMRLPPHWQPEARFSHTRAWAAGLVAALREALAETARRAAAKAPVKYVGDAAQLAYTYLAMLAPAGELLAPAEYRPVGERLAWIASGSGASPARLADAVSEHAQAELETLGRTLGRKECGAAENKKLMLAIAGRTTELATAWFRGAEQYYYALDCLYRGFALETRPADAEQMFETLEQIREAVADSRAYRPDAFAALVKKFGEDLARGR